MRSRSLVLPALLVANVALACGPWLVRLARDQAFVGPVAAGFWRLALAIPVLILAARRLEPRSAFAGPAGRVAATAGIAFAADLALWHVGILHTRVANATLLGNIAAITFPLWGFVAARRRPAARQTAALALAAAGGVLLLGRSYQLSPNNLLGDLACIAAGLFYTVYLVGIARAQDRLGPVTILAIASTIGAPLLLLAALGLGEPVWPATWTPLLLLTLGSQLVGQGLILFAVGRASSLLVGLMLLTQPIVAAAYGWLVYGEQLGVPDALGAVAVAAAVLLVREPRDPLPSATAELGTQR